MHSYYITPEQYDTAERNGIKKATLENRVFSLCWPAEKACTKPTKKQTATLEPMWKEKAEELGISVQCLRLRIRQGWTEERALSTPKVVGSIRKKHMLEDVERAKANGISYEMYVRRRNSGWSIEDACTVPIMTKSEAAKRSLLAKREKQLLRREARGNDGITKATTST